MSFHRVTVAVTARIGGCTKLCVGQAPGARSQFGQVHAPYWPGVCCPRRLWCGAGLSPTGGGPPAPGKRPMSLPRPARGLVQVRGLSFPQFFQGEQPRDRAAPSAGLLQPVVRGDGPRTDFCVEKFVSVGGCVSHGEPLKGGEPPHRPGGYPAGAAAPCAHGHCGMGGGPQVSTPPRVVRGEQMTCRVTTGQLVVDPPVVHGAARNGVPAPVCGQGRSLGDGPERKRIGLFR